MGNGEKQERKAMSKKKTINSFSSILQRDSTAVRYSISLASSANCTGSKLNLALGGPEVSPAHPRGRSRVPTYLTSQRLSRLNQPVNDPFLPFVPKFRKSVPNFLEEILDFPPGLLEPAPPVQDRSVLGVGVLVPVGECAEVRVVLHETAEMMGKDEDCFELDALLCLKHFKFSISRIHAFGGCRSHLGICNLKHLVSLNIRFIEE